MVLRPVFGPWFPKISSSNSAYFVLVYFYESEAFLRGSRELKFYDVGFKPQQCWKTAGLLLRLVSHHLALEPLPVATIPPV